MATLSAMQKDTIEKTRDDIYNKVIEPLQDLIDNGDIEGSKANYVVEEALRDLFYILYAEENDEEVQRRDSIFYEVAKGNNVRD